ncbi:LOW QUALITY PROTEIN: uncharacterized protein LOC108598030 [Drosophila busckii]|uniref:LOW QUALITY PROTEIN: uncharacterized protein LOC108598030 n=1 Tax=Drosophila busckii TaxID=30019 RepID=UPI001432FA52|nr:LOW QUALITY PROTEIN: uncharacterized protein LOC108598030 [Drosophila busckii]
MLFYSCMQHVLAKGVVFRTGACRYDRDVFSNFTIQVIHNKIHMDMMLIQSLRHGLKGHVSFELRLPKANSYQSRFQHDINYCEMIKGARESFYRRWYLSMMKTANFARSVPLLQAYYYLKGWDLEGNQIPSFLYLGDYRITGSFYYGKYKKISNPLLECSLEGLLKT